MDEVASDEVEQLLHSLNLKKDKLDEASFDIVEYINELFPTEQSLGKIEDVILEINEEIEDLDAKSREAIRADILEEESGQKVIESASGMIQSLFSQWVFSSKLNEFLRIREVQERATNSEQTVKEITRDIQQLDQAKHNLTLSITTLNNLLLVVEALDSLNDILKINIDKTDKPAIGNPFDEVLTALPYTKVEEQLDRAQRLLEPMKKAYFEVDSIQGLQRELDEIHRVLQERVGSELKSMLSSVNFRNMSQYAESIKAGCHLLEILPKESIKDDLIKWFISQALCEYKELFEPNQTIAWLDKIDHRYSWLRSNLETFTAKCTTFFPKHWSMLERLVVEFCRITRTDLEGVMQSRKLEITHSLYIFAVQRTLIFENSLAQVCNGETLQVATNKAKSTNPFDGAGETRNAHSNPFGSDSDEEGKVDEQTFVVVSSGTAANPFDGIVSKCFVKHFDIYLAHAEKALSDPLYGKFVGDFTVNQSSLANREVGDVLKGVEGSAAGGADNSLNSATDLFLLYKQLLKHTLLINKGSGLLDLTALFRKYLILYAEKVLVPNIADVHLTLNSSLKDEQHSNSSSNTLGAVGLPKDFSDTREVASTALAVAGNLGNQLITSLMRDDQSLGKLSNEDRHKACIVLVTAAYCARSVAELEKRIKGEIRPESLAGEVNFEQEIEALNACRMAAVGRLVRDLDSRCEQHVAAMARFPWASFDQVGDQSAYVTAIVGQLRSLIPPMRDTLFSVRPQFTQICIKFADALIQRFISNLFKCKPMNAFGAEQLLLDTQSLKAILLQLPTIGSQITQPPPRPFTALVQEGMGRAESVIKAVMLPIGSQPSAAASGASEDNSQSSRRGFVRGPIDEKASDSFLGSFHQLLPNVTVGDLQKILEMKGVKRGEQTLVLDMYKQKYNQKANASVTESRILNTSTNTLPVNTALDNHAVSRIRQLERFIKGK